jgi:hypothetical protein
MSKSSKRRSYKKSSIDETPRIVPIAPKMTRPSQWMYSYYPIPFDLGGDVPTSPKDNPELIQNGSKQDLNRKLKNRIRLKEAKKLRRLYNVPPPIMVPTSSPVQQSSPMVPFMIPRYYVPILQQSQMKADAKDGDQVLASPTSPSFYPFSPIMVPSPMFSKYIATSSDSSSPSQSEGKSSKTNFEEFGFESMSQTPQMYYGNGLWMLPTPLKNSEIKK